MPQIRSNLWNFVLVVVARPYLYSRRDGARPAPAQTGPTDHGKAFQAIASPGSEATLGGVLLQGDGLRLREYQTECGRPSSGGRGAGEREEQHVQHQEDRSRAATNDGTPPADRPGRRTTRWGARRTSPRQPRFSSTNAMMARMRSRSASCGHDRGRLGYERPRYGSNGALASRWPTLASSRQQGQYLMPIGSRWIEGSATARPGRVVAVRSPPSSRPTRASPVTVVEREREEQRSRGQIMFVHGDRSKEHTGTGDVTSRLHCTPTARGSECAGAEPDWQKRGAIGGKRRAGS